MSRQEGEKQPKKAPPRGANPRRRTQAQLLALQLAIVSDRDLRSLTWAEIGRKHGLGEKEARESYLRYLNEIAPLIADAGSHEQAQEYLRAYENVRRRFLETADSADNASARVGALREFRNTLSEEIKLRQHVGLMPKDPDGARARARADDELGVQRIEAILLAEGLSSELGKKLAAAFDDESEQ